MNVSGKQDPTVGYMNENFGKDVYLKVVSLVEVTFSGLNTFTLPCFIRR